VGAARQPAQDVLGADDRQREALERAVQRRGHHQAARFDHAGAAAHEGREIGDVLDHFHGEHQVETLARVGQGLGRRRAVIDRKTARRGVQARRRDVGLRRVHPDHGRPQPGQRFAQDAGAAADIEDAQPVEAFAAFGVAGELPAGGVADIGEAGRIELVQHAHAAARIPPVGGQRGEPRHLAVVDRRARSHGWRHRVSWRAPAVRSCGGGAASVGIYASLRAGARRSTLRLDQAPRRPLGASGIPP
jgi:hypothetical protein